jgi:20S proteasome subunit beta 6
MSRNTSKIAKLTEKTFIASSGMYADFTALTKHLSVQLTNYKFNLEKEASTQSIAQLLSNMLY